MPALNAPSRRGFRFGRSAASNGRCGRFASIRAGRGVSAARARAPAARADPPVWRVHAAHAEVVLFGSVHLLSAATQWKTPALEQSLARSAQLWFEIPFTPQTQADAARQALQLGLLPAGQTLSSLLDPATADRVGRLAAADGLQPAALERMRPWLAELMLSTFYFKTRGADQDLGVELQIDHDAPASAAREAFETVSEQIHLFADDPLADQVASLKQTLDEIADDPGLFDRLAAAWARGDVAALVREVIMPTKRDTPGVYQRLLVARNRRFAARIEAMLQGSGRAFVVVGVGPLVGPARVAARLRRDGVAGGGP